jgi:ribonucleoside-diphosphate reductase alpha chain
VGLETLRADLMRFGARNSMLTALMPTTSTSQILGNSEGFEPIQANVFKRTTLAGEFLVVNKHLMKDLMSGGLWDDTMRTDIIKNDGSAAAIARIPEHLKKRYRTVWEIGQRNILDHAVARAPFVDQSQSMNLFFAVPNYQKLNSALIYAWRKELKTGVYYMRSKPAVEAIKTSTLLTTSEDDAKLACSRDHPEACVMCSA